MQQPNASNTSLRAQDQGLKAVPLCKLHLYTWWSSPTATCAGVYLPAVGANTLPEPVQLALCGI